MAARDRDQEDLSRLADGSLTDAGGMLAGGMADPGDSMTAEGSEPSEPLAGDTEPAAPHARADVRDYRRIVHGPRS